MVRAKIAERATNALQLPPVYRQVLTTLDVDPMTAAREMVGPDETQALFVWGPRADLAQCAVALLPDRPLADARRIVFAAVTAIGDALAALVPPAVDVSFGWPDRIEVNGAAAGAVRLSWPEATAAVDVPPWMVLGLELRISPSADAVEPGRTPDRTTLHDEGCADIGTADVLESFARHFVYWVNRWEEDGFGPIRASWLARASGRDTPAVIRSGGCTIEGRILALSEDGDLVIDSGAATETLALADGLSDHDRRGRGDADGSG